MSILTFDFETQSLDATGKKVILGSVCEKNKEEDYSLFTSTKPEEIWNKILAIGYREARQGKNVYAYAHNLKYDFYNAWDKRDESVTIEGPLIKRPTSEKTRILFLDTMLLIPQPLQTIAQWLGDTKKRPPETLWNKMTIDGELQKYTIEEMALIKEYCEHDTIITMKLIDWLKQSLQQNGIRTRKLITRGNLAIKALIQYLNEEHKNVLFKDMQKTLGRIEAIRKQEPDMIAKAYRSGRKQVIQTGKHYEVTELDVNSMYPYCAMKIQIPNLKTKRYIKEPLELYSKKELFRKIGASKALIQTKETNAGHLPIRWKTTEETKVENEYPNQRLKIIGTYTHEELQWLENNGHKVIDIEETTIYEPLQENPLKGFFEKLYDARKQGPLAKAFYKGIMNNLVGKLGEQQEYTTKKIANVEEAPKLQQQGWKIEMPVSETEYLYKKTTIKRPAPWYMPIIPAYVNAKARNIVNDHLKQLGNDALYVITDAITLKNWNKHKNKFKIGTELGEWSIKNENTQIEIRAKDTYSIANDIRIAGVPKAQKNWNQWRDGIVTYKRMKNIGNIKKEEIGQFETIAVNTLELQEKWLDKQEELKTQELMIDHNETEIDYFQDKGLI